MEPWSMGSIVLVIALGAFTAVTAYWDFKYWKIPNFLTLPMFAAGWVFQGAMHGVPGLIDGGWGFLIGFGVLYVLWMVGGGGGGDVKLMGALSVWLGYRLTLYLLIVSTILVVLFSLGVVIWNVLTRGTRATQNRFTAAGKTGTVAKPKEETVQDRQRRRVMGYAIPVCFGTWLVLGWFIPRLERQLRAGDVAAPPGPIAPAPADRHEDARLPATDEKSPENTTVSPPVTPEAGSASAT